jgi:hypothetical protein
LTTFPIHFSLKNQYDLRFNCPNFQAVMRHYRAVMLRYQAVISRFPMENSLIVPKGFDAVTLAAFPPI